MVSYIYKITNLINGKMYIGQTVNPERRRKQHFATAKKLKENPNLSSNRRFNMPITRAIIKYGEVNFLFEIIDQVEIEKIDEIEQYWIEYYNTYFNGYNATLGGQKNKKRNTINDQEICQEYLNGKSIRTIKREKHLSDDTISMVLKRNNIPIRIYKEVPKEIVQKIISEYPQISLTQLSKKYHKDIDTIKKLLQNNNIKIQNNFFKKKIIQKNINNEILNEFASLSDACRAINTPTNHTPRLRKAAEQNKLYLGYLWELID